MIVVVLLAIAAAVGTPAFCFDEDQRGDTASVWSNVLYFRRGSSHEVADSGDSGGGVVTVPQTFCHGKHCAYYRQPFEFVCAHRTHIALVESNATDTTLADAFRGIASTQAEAGSRGEARRYLRGGRTTGASRASTPAWVGLITPIAREAAESNSFAHHALTNGIVVVDAAVLREVGGTSKSFANKRRYFPLPSDELDAVLRPDLIASAGRSAADARAFADHARGLFGDLDAWQPAVVGRFLPSFARERDSETPSQLSAGHPLHRLRLVAHSSAGTYEASGNKRMAALVARSAREGEGSPIRRDNNNNINTQLPRHDAEEVDEAFSSGMGPARTPARRKPSLLPLSLASAPSLPKGLDVTLADWACAARRPALLEPAIAIESIHILCAASADVEGSAPIGLGAESRWEQLLRVTASAAWAGLWAADPVAGGAAADRASALLGAPYPARQGGRVTYGAHSTGRSACALGDPCVNYTLAHHCSLHYHLVNYGDPAAKMGVVALAVATVAFVVVMLFFVGGKWYREKVATHRTRAALRRMDKEAAERARRRHGAVDESRGLLDTSAGAGDPLPPDVSALNAFGGHNGRPVQSTGIDPAVVRAMLSDECSLVRRRRGGGSSGGMQLLDIGGGDSVEVGAAGLGRHDLDGWHPAKASLSHPNRPQGPAGGSGGVYDNPRNLTLGDLMGAGSASPHFGSMSPPTPFSSLASNAAGSSSPSSAATSPSWAHHRAHSSSAAVASSIAVPWDGAGLAAELVQTIDIDAY